MPTPRLLPPLLLLVLACATGKDLTSRDVLDRPAAAEKVEVKQVLVAWDDRARFYKAGLDEAAKARTREQAEALVEQVLAELRGGAPIEPLMAQHSSDKGSAQTGEGYEVVPEAPYEPVFIKLSLRLKPDEIGLVRTNYGWHILKRVK